MELACALEEAVKEAGFWPLKAKQREALEAFVSGRDTFVALPTGYGKSIIYAILPNVYDKIRGIYSNNCDNVMSISYRNRHCNCGVYIPAYCYYGSVYIPAYCYYGRTTTQVLAEGNSGGVCWRSTDRCCSG